tara:strand:- start:541 stop:1449 length:909 start_codon:yes stop_codon:yes gene_type:complete
MIKNFLNVSFETDHPHPLTSPDYYDPAGSIQDNSTCQYFIWELDTYFLGSPYRLLDFGCAGGQFVVDIYNKGYPWYAAGIEGGNIHAPMDEEFENEIDAGDAGKLNRARGYDNWRTYKDKCLFNADLSKPFKIYKHNLELPAGQHQLYDLGDDYDSAKEELKFDVVTSWEFLEHPHPDEIGGILRNMNKHLKMHGFALGTINLSPGEHHRCIKTIEEWDLIFREYGFDLVQDNMSIWGLSTPHMFPFRTTPRVNVPHVYGGVKPFEPSSTYNAMSKFYVDPERSTEEGKNYAYFYVKMRECD